MSVLGIFLVTLSSNKDAEKINGVEQTDKYEPMVMGVFTLISTFLLSILIIKSPYIYVWESFPKDVQMGFVPEDGRGLKSPASEFLDDNSSSDIIYGIYITFNSV